MHIVPKNPKKEGKLDNENLENEDEMLDDEELDRLLDENEEMIQGIISAVREQVLEEVAEEIEITVREEIAITMLTELNLDIDLVHKATGLSKGDLEELLAMIEDEEE